MFLRKTYLLRKLFKTHLFRNSNVCCSWRENWVLIIARKRTKSLSWNSYKFIIVRSCADVDFLSIKCVQMARFTGWEHIDITVHFIAKW